MRLEAGKFYRDRTGRLRGPVVPVRRTSDNTVIGFRLYENGDVAGFDWYPDGRLSTSDRPHDEDLVEKATGPITWSDLTPDAKGLLLLAYHEGKQIQMYFDAEREWEDVDPQWAPNRAYRVKPTRTTVSIFGYIDMLGDDGSWAEWAEDAAGQYVITVELENGKPVGVTIHDMYE